MTSLIEAVDGIVHEPTQTRDGDGVDLTVTEIYAVENRGEIDFGGGELEAADVVPHSKEFHHEDDTYQWWHLNGGLYLIEYNESLSTSAYLQPHVEVLERGASNPSLQVKSLPMVPLRVSAAGIAIKENARVSVIRPV